MTHHNEYNRPSGHKHARNRRVHLKRNIKERFDVSITNAELKQILIKVKGRKLKPDKYIPDGTRTYLIQFKGKLMRFLYDPYRKHFITVLKPLDYQKADSIEEFIDKQKSNIGNLGEIFKKAMQ